MEGIKNKLVVLVDFSNYTACCWYPALAAQKADPKYDPHEVLKTNLLGKIATIKRAVEDSGYSDYRIWFIEDRKALRKYEAFPLYKANRERDGVPLPCVDAKAFLKEQGYTSFFHSPDNEADDAIATLAQNSVRCGVDVIIASSDKDLWQLIQPGVEVYTITKDRFVTTEQIEDAFGVKYPHQIPVVKALWGDSGDNVPNAVPRMQKQLLPFVQMLDDSLEHLWHVLDYSKLTTRCKELLTQGRKQVETNYGLVKLRKDCPIVVEETK